MLSVYISTGYFPTQLFFFTDLCQKLYSELASDEPIQVSRESVLPDLLRCYDNDDVVSLTIKVTFTDEAGEDCGGLTQDTFSAFWEQAFDMHFDGVVFLTLVHSYISFSFFLVVCYIEIYTSIV